MAALTESDPPTLVEALEGSYTLKGMLFYFLRLGATGFGGPLVLVEHMQDELVTKRQWITLEEYSEGLALAQLAPGPLAAQLAIYLGWIRSGLVGATLVGIAFILPSLLIVLALAELYRRYQSLPWLQGLFYGIGAAVIAIIAQSSLKLVRRTIAKDHVLMAVVAINALVTFSTQEEVLWVFLLSGVIALLLKAPPRLRSKPMLSWIPASLLLGIYGEAPPGELTKLFLFFAKAGSVVFGSGLAIVPFLHGGVVENHHWLNERQFLDAVAVAMITPGPIVITVAFIGYLVAGLLGGMAAAAGVFLPVYLFVVVLAPYYSRIAHNKQIKAFVDGVTSAAIGAIIGAAVILAQRAIVDVQTVSICLVSLGIVFRIKKFPEPVLILCAGIVGVLLKRI